MSATHGTAWIYRNMRYACRCDDCRTANTERARAEKRSRVARLAADPTLAPHGKASTYNNWGCRCPLCVAANTERGRAYKQGRRAS